MNVLVTGGSGVIGKEVVELLKKTHNVSIFDRTDNDKDNLLDLGSVNDAVSGNDVVVHLAAIPRPMKVPYRDYFNNNILGTFNIAEACCSNGVKRFIFSSSTAYYGFETSIGRKVPVDEKSSSVVEFARPNDRYVPQQLYYGVSKVCSESLLFSYGASKQLQVVILRFGPVPEHLGIGLSLKKAAESVKLCVDYTEELWYEVFNVCTKGEVNTNKIESILGFSR